MQILRILALGLVAFVVSAQDPPPVETCGTDVPKMEPELRAMECPRGFTGQWFQERDAGSCEWYPNNPQWFACSIVIEPHGADPQ